MVSRPPTPVGVDEGVRELWGQGLFLIVHGKLRRSGTKNDGTTQLKANKKSPCTSLLWMGRQEQKGLGAPTADGQANGWVDEAHRRRASTISGAMRM